MQTLPIIQDINGWRFSPDAMTQIIEDIVGKPVDLLHTPGHGDLPPVHSAYVENGETMMVILDTEVPLSVKGAVLVGSVVAWAPQNHMIAKFNVDSIAVWPKR